MERNPFHLLPKEMRDTFIAYDSSVYAILNAGEENVPFHIARIVLDDEPNISLQQQFDSWIEQGRVTTCPFSMTLENVKREFPVYVAIAGSASAKTMAMALEVTIHRDFQLLTENVRDLGMPLSEKRPAPMEEELEVTAKKPRPADDEDSMESWDFGPSTSWPYFHAEFAEQLGEYIESARYHSSTNTDSKSSSSEFTFAMAQETFTVYSIEQGSLPGALNFSEGLTETPPKLSALYELSSGERPNVENGIEAAYQRFNIIGILGPILEYEVVPPPSSNCFLSTICWNWSEDYNRMENEGEELYLTARGSTIVALEVKLKHDGIYFIIDAGRPPATTSKEINVPAHMYWMMMPSLPPEASSQLNRMRQVYYCGNEKDFIGLYEATSLQNSVFDTTLFYTKLWLYILGDFIGESIDDFLGFQYSSVLIHNSPATTIINPNGHEDPMSVTNKWIENMKSGASCGTYLGREVGKEVAIIDALGAAPFPVYNLQVGDNSTDPVVIYEIASTLVRFGNDKATPHHCYTIDNEISPPGNNIINWPEVMPPGMEMLRGSNLLARRNGEVDSWLSGYEIAVMLIQYQIRCNQKGQKPELFSGFAYHDVLSLRTPCFSHRVLSPFLFTDVLPSNDPDGQFLTSCSSYSNRLGLHLFLGRVYSYCESLALYMNNLTGNAIHYIPLDREPLIPSLLNSVIDCNFDSRDPAKPHDQIHKFIESMQFALFGILLPNRSKKYLWRWSRTLKTNRPDWTSWGITTPHLVQGCTLVSLMVNVPSTVGIPFAGTKIDYKRTAIFSEGRAVAFCPRLVSDNLYHFTYQFPESLYLFGRIMDEGFSPEVWRVTWEYPISSTSKGSCMVPRMLPSNIFGGLDCFDYEFKVAMVRLDTRPAVIRYPVFIIPPNSEEENATIIRFFTRSDGAATLTNWYDHVQHPLDDADDYLPYTLFRPYRNYALDT